MYFSLETPTHQPMVSPSLNDSKSSLIGNSGTTRTRAVPTSFPSFGPHFADAAPLAGDEPALGIERAELQREGARRIDRADQAAVPIVGQDLELDASRPA